MNSLGKALFSAVLAMGLVGFIAIPANGSTDAGKNLQAAHLFAATRAATHQAAPATGEFLTVLPGGFTDSYPCEPENYNWDYPSTPIEEVVNGCPVRVWLHEYVNGVYQHAGWAYCVSPNSEVVTVPVQYRKPFNIQISENGSPC